MSGRPYPQVLRVIFLAILSPSAIAANAEKDDSALQPLSLGGVFTQAETITFPNGSSVPLLIEYGKEIDTTSFVAKLNGVEISTLFMPKAGARESITLPFNPDHEYRLRLSASNRRDNHPQVVERHIFFSRIGNTPGSTSYEMSRMEMERLDLLMKEAEANNIPLTERGEFLRNHGFRW